MTLPEPNYVSGALCVAGFSLIVLSAAWDNVMEGRFGRPVAECTPTARRLYYFARVGLLLVAPAQRPFGAVESVTQCLPRIKVAKWRTRSCFG
jgi:hypothetical protein